MIEDDHIQPQVARRGERREAGRAAIDGNDQRCSRCGKLAERFGIRTVALEDAIGNVEDRVAPLVAEETRKERHRGRPVDVIVAKYRNRCAANHCIGDARRRPVHVGQDRRVGHQHFQRGGQERGCGIGVDPPPGKHASDDIGNAVALGDRERGVGAGTIQSIDPAPAGQRARHAEEGTIRHGISRGGDRANHIHDSPSYRAHSALSVFAPRSPRGRLTRLPRDQIARPG